MSFRPRGARGLIAINHLLTVAGVHCVGRGTLKEHDMGMLMITCPETGRRAFTGIQTDAASLTLIPPVNAQLACPRCGHTHVWSILDAELVNDLCSPYDRSRE